MRECGECSTCCYLAEVEFSSYKKPAHKRCLEVIDNPSQRKGSCKIYGQACRPTICNTYKCLWLEGAGEPDDRPDNSGVMLSVNDMNGGTWVFALETKPNAILTSARNIVLNVARAINLPIIVSSHGVLPPHDTGELVIVKDALLSRCRYLAGEKMHQLAADVAIYKLIDSK